MGRTPTLHPTATPTTTPTFTPTQTPSASPTVTPTTLSPTFSPTYSPTANPTYSPTLSYTYKAGSQASTSDFSCVTESGTYTSSSSETLWHTGRGRGKVQLGHAVHCFDDG